MCSHHSCQVLVSYTGRVHVRMYTYSWAFGDPSKQDTFFLY